MINETAENIVEVKTKKRKLLFTALKAVMTIGILYYLISFIEYEKIADAVETADYRLVFAAFLLMFLNIYLQYKKWHLICLHVLKIKDSKKILKSLFTGFSGGIITPFKLGEFVARAVPFKGVGLVEISLATAIDKLFPLATVSFIGGVSAIFFSHYYYSVSFLITSALFLAFTGGYYLLFLMITNRKFWEVLVYGKLSRIKILEKQLPKMKMLSSLSNRLSWKIAFITLIYYLTFTSQMALLIAAFLHEYDFLNYFWISNLVIFSQTVIPQVTIAELGIREGSTVFFMGLIGLSAAAGFNAAVLLFIINLVLPAVAGAFLIITENND